MKKVSFAPKPLVNNSGLSVDQWVADQGAAEPIKRLTIDMPESLHKRVKVQCAVQGLVIAEVVRQFLEQRFPETPSGGEGA